MTYPPHPLTNTLFYRIITLEIGQWPFLDTKNYMNKIFAYFREAIAEMKKVVWPTKKQTINYTLVVIALSISVAVFFGILDYVFNLGLAQFLQIK